MKKRGYEKLVDDVFKGHANPPDDFNKSVDFVLDNFMLPKYAEALKMYYGLGQEQCTYAEMAIKLNKSSERCRQMVAKALRILCQPSNYRYLHYGCKAVKEMNKDLEPFEQLCERHIDEAFLSLSVRSYNSLRQMGCHTIGSVINLSDDEILARRNLGNKSLEEIKRHVEKILNKYGISRKTYLESIGKKVNNTDDCIYKATKHYNFCKSDYTEEEWRTILKIFNCPEESNEITLYGPVKAWK